MKVKIGKYKDWLGPYQLAEKLCFWAKPVTDEYGLKDKPEWVHKFGEWLAHGSIEREEEIRVGERTKLFGDDRPKTWLYKFLLWIDKNRRERKIEVHIDEDDWNYKKYINSNDEGE